MFKIALLTALLMGIMMAAMAVGVIFSNRELKGSCGGPGGADCACDKAGRPRACEALDDVLAKRSSADSED